MVGLGIENHPGSELLAEPRPGERSRVDHPLVRRTISALTEGRMVVHRPQKLCPAIAWRVVDDPPGGPGLPCMPPLGSFSPEVCPCLGAGQASPPRLPKCRRLSRVPVSRRRSHCAP